MDQDAGYVMNKKSQKNNDLATLFPEIAADAQQGLPLIKDPMVPIEVINV